MTSIKWTVGSIVSGIVTIGFVYTILILNSSNTDSDIKLERQVESKAVLPLVINTWAFTEATKSGYAALQSGGNVLDAVEIGCSQCEVDQCDGTVGYGGSPDEKGETTLDAMIMDGNSHNVGAVGALRGIKSAISVARHVLQHTEHSLLVGSQATDFATQMKFTRENLTTHSSENIYEHWLTKNCQPNYWIDVDPPSPSSCGPYSPTQFSMRDLEEVTQVNVEVKDTQVNVEVKDTIGLIAIDEEGRIACGTSSNGANHKIAGRVGDAPIPGSGCYVDKYIGGAAATGDGDIMMRFSPSLLTVQHMDNGLSPSAAATKALSQIIEYYPQFAGGIVAASINGTHGGACHNFNHFEYSLMNAPINATQVISVQCSYK